MKRIFNYIMLVLMILTLSSISLAKDYRNKNIIIKGTKIITLKKNHKGSILYVLKKGRYRIKLSPNNIDYIDSYIVGQAEEFNPSIEKNSFEYEVDTNKMFEVFRQEYKANSRQKVKIKIEKLE